MAQINESSYLSIKPELALGFCLLYFYLLLRHQFRVLESPGSQRTCAKQAGDI